jgi:hypothetical protein
VSKPIVAFHRLAFVAAVVLTLPAAPAAAGTAGFGGTMGYTGKLGPVSARLPLCLCVYRDAALNVSLGCLISGRNNVTYEVDLGRNDYHLIAFLDIHINERVDPDEPYEIYSDRALPPADAVAGASGRTDVDLVFGDENIGSLSPPASSTPTPSLTPTVIPSATSTSSPTSSATAPPTATPTCPAAKNPICDGDCSGDCNGDGKVEVNELIVIVGDALGRAGAAACAAGDADGDGTMQLDEVVAAVRSSMAACP